MKKYDLLELHFLSLSKPKVTLTFSEFEEIGKFNLPMSAYKYKAWWSNGGHQHSYIWVNAGYFSTDINLIRKTVSFVKKGYKELENIKSRCKNRNNKLVKLSNLEQKRYLIANNASKYIIDEYIFNFIQYLIPELKDSVVKEYSPQKEYLNIKKLPLNLNGYGSFCKFSINIHNFSDILSGVYIWVVNNEILYIGETENMQKRFNNGYGKISPRNCYKGGQSTNCKMNKVVMEYYKKEAPIKLYFLQTKDHKIIESKLLQNITTKYNNKRK